MKLPIEEHRPLKKKIELLLAYSLHLREAYGQRLEPVILAPELGRDYLGEGRRRRRFRCPLIRRKARSD